MATTLTIAGTNFLDQYKSTSAEITERLNNDANTMEIQIVRKPAQNIPKEGSEVIFEHDGNRQFAGILTRKEGQETGKGDFFVYTLEVTDWSYLLNQKNASIAYEDKTLKFIVEDLLNRYVDSGYGFTTTNVATGPEIADVTFDHETLRKAFEKLSKLTGFIWWVDYNRNVHFQEPDADQAPEEITDTSENHSQIAIEYDTSQIRNSVIVIGSDEGEGAATFDIDNFVGDGESRTFDLGDKPHEIDYIKVNGDSKQFSEDINEKDDDYFIYSFEGEYIRDVSGNAELTGSDTIEIRWKARVPIIVEQSDQASIDFFSNLDGGDGVYEHTIKESDIRSKASARARAQEELDAYSDPLIIGRFRTDSKLKNTTSPFEPGQALTVHLPSWNINEETVYLIREVVKTIEEDGTDVFYKYDVRFGGRMVGLEEFLDDLSRDTEDVRLADEIKVIHRLRDSMKFADETPEQATETPPYEYGELFYLESFAEGDQVLEDFEDQDISMYNNNTGEQVEAVAAHDGSYGLGTTDGTKTSYFWRDDVTVQQGDTFTAWLHPDDTGDDAAVAFAVSGSNAGYAVTLDYTAQDLEINKDGTPIVVSTPMTILEQWYKVEIEWTETGDINVTVYDSDGTTVLETLSANDTAYTSGGIGWLLEGGLAYADTFTLIRTGMGDWKNDAAADIDWISTDQASPTSDTGPSAAYDGDFYALFETSNSAAGEEGILEYTNTFATDHRITFSYHMYGVDVNSLRFETYDGTSWTQQWEQSGDKGDNWIVDMADIPAGTEKIRFVGVAPVGFKGDIGLDELRIVGQGSPRGKWNLSEWT